MRRLFVMLLMSLVLVGCGTIPQGGGAATDYYNQGRAAYDVGDFNGAVINFPWTPALARPFMGLARPMRASTCNLRHLTPI